MNPNLRKNVSLRSKHLIFGKSDATRGKNADDVKFDIQVRQKAAIRNAITRASLFEKIWYIVFIIAGLLSLIFVRPFTFTLAFAVVSLYLNMVSNNLTANGNKYGILIAILSSILYCIDCFVFKIYGELLVNILLYIPIYVVSFISFNKNTNTENENDQFLEVKRMKLWQVLVSVLALLVGAFALYLILELIGSAFALVNSISIVAFLVAMIVRVFRYMEFWWFDLLGSIAGVVLWVMASTSDLSSLPFIISTLSSILNSIYGFVVWKRLYRKSLASKGILLNHHGVKISKIIKIRRRYQKLYFDKKINVS